MGRKEVLKWKGTDESINEMNFAVRFGFQLCVPLVPALCKFLFAHRVLATVLRQHPLVWVYFS